MQTITSPAGAFSYAYNPGLNGYTASSLLVSNLAFASGAYINDYYDSNGRMLMTTLYNSTNGAIDSTAYTNNMANQRISQVRGGNNWAAYTYDSTGQLLSDSAFEAVSGATRLNEQLKYAYDSAGNLITRTNNALAQNFYVNALNELTTNTGSGTLTVMGTTTSAATNVTVNSTTASNYADATFAAPGFSLSTTHFTATARDTNGRVSVNTVSVTLSNTVTFQYDGNGNLTNDGLRNFAYDDENQLIQVWVASQWMSKFIYDGKMRRRIRQELTWTNSAWMQTNAVYYIYDGNLVIQERNVYNVPTANYVRGLDLSGSLQGAGGIGGLLAWTNLTTSQNAFYYSDGGGNVRTLINSSNAIVAKYTYNAFGNILSKSGSLADANLYRFSGKETHLNSGVVYYLYRYYDPKLQRWLNRDPILELGGPNLYKFVANAVVNWIDKFGLDRTVYFFGHTWIAVDTYDSNGNSNGTVSLDFSPEHLYNPGASDWGINPTPSYPQWLGYTIPSSQQADQDLLQFWQDAQTNPNLPNWNPVNNCWVETGAYANYGNPSQPNPRPPQFYGK